MAFSKINPPSAPPPHKNPAPGGGQAKPQQTFTKTGLESLNKSGLNIPKPRESFGEKPAFNGVEFLKKDANLLPSRREQKNTGDLSIFGGKAELSRPELRYKLKKDPRVWRAGKAARFDLSPAEREKLESQVFPQIYGKNISKADLSARIRLMQKERGNTVDLKKKERLRREINFLKKIGGIK